jgi:hypothetical protein
MKQLYFLDNSLFVIIFDAALKCRLFYVVFKYGLYQDHKTVNVLLPVDFRRIKIKIELKDPIRKISII